MARTVHNTNLYSREQRAKLAIQAQPYFMSLGEGEHLGYYKGKQSWTWVARYRPPGKGLNYVSKKMGTADDYADADGEIVLNFKQAQAAARVFFTHQNLNVGRLSGSYTVSDALNDYIGSFRGKDLENTKRRIEKFIRPQLVAQLVVDLTATTISHWLDALSKSCALVRTGRGKPQNYRDPDASQDGVRKRRASANRVFTMLKAALNASFHLEPDPKVVEQYQSFMIHASLRRDGVDHDMDWHCPTRA